MQPIVTEEIDALWRELKSLSREPAKKWLNSMNKPTIEPRFRQWSGSRNEAKCLKA